MPPRHFNRAPAKKGTFKRLVKQLFKRFPGELIFSAFCIVFNVFGNVCSSVFANFVTTCISNSVLTNTNPFTESQTFTTMGITLTATLPTLLIGLGVIYTIGIFASWGWNRTMAIVTHKYLNEFRIALFTHMQDLPIKYFDTHKHGHIMSIYTNDIDTIRQFVSQALPTMFSAILAVTFVMVVMLMNSIWMTLVPIAGVLVMFFNTKIIGGRASKYFVKQQQAMGTVEGNIQEAMKGLKVIKVFSHEEKSAEEFEKLNDEYATAATQGNIHGNIMVPINGNVGNFIYVLSATVGCMILILPNFQNLTFAGLAPVNENFIGSIVAFLLMNRMFTNNINNLSQEVTFIVMGMAGASRCFDLIDEQVEMDDGYVTLVHVKEDEKGNLIETEERTREYAWKHPHKATGETTYTPLKGDIVLDNVDFSYNGQKLVLEDISIYAKPGQKIALVGATGAGKTTITNLINRFYPLADGKVRYDGININKIKKDDLRRSLGIVLQDVNLFTGTVMENIRYGRLDATDEEVYEAAKIANAYDFIMRLPEGFNTMLTGDGANLSQGQRQLISIARAAIADAPVMILDEATSSIDTRTELLVQKGTDKLMEGRTVFVIAHRLSTVQNSDAIMVLDHGHIIERGSHNDLIAQKGVYYQLYTGAFELE